MIEFFVFLGCVVLTAIIGVYAIYLGLLILAAFTLLYLYNKKYESEYIKRIIISSKECFGGIGLFIIVMGILFMSKSPLDYEMGRNIIFIIKLIGVVLISMLLISPIVIYIYNHMKRK